MQPSNAATFHQNFMVLGEVCKTYKLSRTYLYVLKYKGLLKHYRLGKRSFIHLGEFEELISRDNLPPTEKKSKKKLGV